jgi:hypothetical protein
MRLALVQSVPMNKYQSAEEAGRIWRSTVAEIPALKKRLRAEVEAKIELETTERRQAAARAIQYALNHGVTKTILRPLTTKDHRNFEEYVALGEKLEAEEGEWEPK